MVENRNRCKDLELGKLKDEGIELKRLWQIDGGLFNPICIPYKEKTNSKRWASFAR
jgi:hypothetical protein